MKIEAFGGIWTRDHYLNRTVYTSFQISKLLSRIDFSFVEIKVYIVYATSLMLEGNLWWKSREESLQ
jgi:hypothetical protein